MLALAPAYLWGIVRCCCARPEFAYAWGGSSSTDQLAANLRFALADHSWSTRTALQLERTLHTAAAAQGQGFSLGGQFGEPANSIDRNDEYSPQADVWASRAALPAPARGQLASAAVAGEIFCFGGSELIPGAPGFPSAVDHAQHDAYQHSADAWQSKTELPAPPRRNHAAAALAGRVHNWGGQAIDELLSLHHSYDPETDVWTERPALPSPPRDAARGAAIHGKGYLLGGRDLTLGRCDEFDPVADSWTTRSPFAAYSLHWPAVAPTRRRLHAFGGVSSATGSLTHSNFNYDPLADAWVTDTELPSPGRAQAAGVAI